MVKQEINPKVLEKLDEYKIPKDEGILCLLAIHHKLVDIEKWEREHELVFKQINVAKIVERNYITKEMIWHIPLYEENGTGDAWEWINSEYRPKFERVDRLKKGSLKSCIVRMKAFFAENPDVRKEEVLQAVDYYIDNLNDKRYLQQADYFISKDKGVNKKSRLEMFLEIVREQNKINAAKKAAASNNTKRPLR